MAHVIRSPRLQKKRRRRIIILSILLVVGIALIVAIPAGLLHLSFWRIKTVNVEGNAAVSTESIQNDVASTTSGSYLHLFPRDNILIYPKGAIVSSLTTQFPRIASASVAMKGISTILVSVTERKPDAVWCSSAISPQVATASSSDCYLLDNTGLIFDKSPEFSNNVYMVYSGNVSGDPLGAHFVNQSDFKSLEDFISDVKSLSLTPVSITAIQNDDYSLALTGGEVILFTLREPLDETISNLQSVLSDPKLALRTSSGISVSSVDLRFGNKVFYKQKGK